MTRSGLRHDGEARRTRSGSFQVVGAALAMFVLAACTGAATAPTTTTSSTTISASTTEATTTTTSAPRSVLPPWERIDVDREPGVEEQWMNAIAASSSLLVAGGGANNDAAIWTSVDAITWERAQTPPTPDATVEWINDVVEGGPGFVAVGVSVPDASMDSDSLLYDGARALVWTSVDGAEWTRVESEAFSAASTSQASAVTAGEAGLIAVGEEITDDVVDAVSWTSPDGVEWQRHTMQTSDDASLWFLANDVTWFAEGAVAVGTEVADAAEEESLPKVAVWHSDDGVEWSRAWGWAVLTWEEHHAIYTVTADDRWLVAGGIEFYGGESEHVPTVWMSGEGLFWDIIVDDVLYDPYQAAIHDIAIVGDGMVAVGWDEGAGAAWVSTDGEVWQRVQHTDDVFGGAATAINGVVVFGDKLVGVGSYGEDDVDLGVWVGSMKGVDPRLVDA